MSKTSFVKSSIIYTIGNLLIKGVSFFTLPIFTRLMLPGEFGKFALYTSALGIVTIFVSLQIQSSIGIAYKRYYNDQQKFNSFIGNTMLLPIIISIFLIIIGSVFPSLSNFLGSNNGSIIIWTLILNALFSSFVTIFTSAMIFEQKPSKHLLYSLVYTLLNVIISVALVIYMSNDTYFARVLGILISTTIIGLILFLQYAKYISISKLISDWKFGLALSLPLIFHVLSQQVLSYVDRFMLDYYINENEVGIYSFVYNIGMIISLLWSSINNAWVPWYYKSLNEGKTNEIKIYSKHYIIFFSIITILFNILSPEITKILGSEMYYSGMKIIPLIATSYYFVFLYSFYVNYQFYKEKTKFVPIATIVAAVINIMLNFILIPKLGYIGATFATLIAYFIMFLMHYFVTRVLLRHKDFPSIYLIVSIISIVVSNILIYLNYNLFIVRLCIGITFLICYLGYLFLNKREILL